MISFEEFEKARDDIHAQWKADLGRTTLWANANEHVKVWYTKIWFFTLIEDSDICSQGYKEWHDQEALFNALKESLENSVKRELNELEQKTKLLNNLLEK